jgi:anaerobic selenocysteine-containing dehydrogenase
VSLVSDAEDGIEREVFGLVVTPFSLPDGCLGAYYPEMNPLMPLSHHDEQSKTPAAKSVPVRIKATGETRSPQEQIEPTGHETRT